MITPHFMKRIMLPNDVHQKRKAPTICNDSENNSVGTAQWNVDISVGTRQQHWVKTRVKEIDEGGNRYVVWRQNIE
ncbi:hypothetical protein Lal_00031112 [Lupinus albus]|nr:hypothetical protein Lal_00031112 [Lupinus albus]